MTAPADFSNLSPDFVTQTVETALGKRATRFCLPMASYINRVFEIELEDKSRVVVKFYRPGRWKREAIQEEHDFIRELAAAEIPVIEPIAVQKDQTLSEKEGILFAVFPKKGGRKLEEPRSDDEWLALGRLIGRIHLVGARKKSSHRLTFTPLAYTKANLETLTQSGFLPADLGRQFREIVESIIQMSSPLFEGSKLIRLHGDCHRGNLLRDMSRAAAGESAEFLVIDFDDMITGPPMQDLWMLLPGRLTDSRREMNLLAEGYETFRPFDYDGLKLIEPLRAMRFLHFSAWCAKQSADASFRKHFPEWGSRAYWIKEISDLHDQREILLTSAT